MKVAVNCQLWQVLSVVAFRIRIGTLHLRFQLSVFGTNVVLPPGATRNEHGTL
jgi:hypothetical protein